METLEQHLHLIEMMIAIGVFFVIAIFFTLLNINDNIKNKNDQ